MSQGEMMYRDNEPSEKPTDFSKSLSLDLAEILNLAREAQTSLNPFIILVRLRSKINKILKENQ